MIEATSPDAEQLKADIRQHGERVMNEGDFSYIDEHLADDYVGHFSMQPVELKGPAEYKETMEMIRTAFPDIEMTIEDMIVENERVAVRLTFRGTNEGKLMGLEPTGKSVEFEAMAFLRYEDGKRVEQWVLSDDLGQMQQLGFLVLPSPGMMLRMVVGKVKSLVRG